MSYCATPFTTIPQGSTTQIPIGLDKPSLHVVYSHSGSASDIKTEVSWQFKHAVIRMTTLKMLHIFMSTKNENKIWEVP